MLMCVSCVACRGVRCDQMSRDHLVHVYACVDASGRTLLLFVKCRTIPYVCDARDQRFQDGTRLLRHRGIPRLLSENGVHIRGSTFVRVGSERSGLAGCRASEPSTPVALRLCLEMSVMEARERG